MHGEQARMHVLLDARMGEGGVGRYARTLHRGLTELGRCSSVTLLERRAGRVGAVASAPYTPWGRRGVARRARHLAATVVHNLSFESIPVDGPLVVTVNDVIPLEHPQSMPNRLRRAAFRRIVARSLRRADAIVVPSARTASALAAHVGEPRGRMVVVPHAVDPAFGPVSAAERADARRRFGGGRPYVAAVGTGRSHKNLAVLEGLSGELARRAGVATIVRGPAVPGSAVRAVPRLPDEELRRFYGGAAMVVVVSLVEGYGYTAVEAAACGTPVVCGGGIGALEVLDGAVTVTDVSDSGALADTVVALLEDGAAAERLAEAGAAAAAALTPRAMAEATFELYRQVGPR